VVVVEGSKGDVLGVLGDERAFGFCSEFGGDSSSSGW